MNRSELSEFGSQEAGKLVQNPNLKGRSPLAKFLLNTSLAVATLTSGAGIVNAARSSKPVIDSGCTTSYDNITHPLSNGELEFFDIAAIKACRDLETGAVTFRNVVKPGEKGYVHNLNQPGQKQIDGYTWTEQVSTGDSGITLDLYRPLSSNASGQQSQK